MHFLARDHLNSLYILATKASLKIVRAGLPKMDVWHSMKGEVFAWWGGGGSNP